MYLKITLFIFGLMYSATLLAQSNKFINKHFDALNSHDINAIINDYDDSTKIYAPNWEGAKVGKAGATEIFSRYFSSTTDLHFQLNNIIDATEKVIVEYTTSGTFDNPEPNTPTYMKGKKYKLNYCTIFIISNGKIKKQVDYFDQVAFLRQVGFFDQK